MTWLSTTATGLDLGAPIGTQDVVLQLRSAGGDAFCATVPAERVRASKTIVRAARSAAVRA